MKEKFEKAMNAGFGWVVVVQYDCRLGEKGEMVSKHKTYDAARKAAKKTGFDEFLAIWEVTDCL